MIVLQQGVCILRKPTLVNSEGQVVPENCFFIISNVRTITMFIWIGIYKTKPGQALLGVFCAFITKDEENRIGVQQQPAFTLHKDEKIHLDNSLPSYRIHIGINNVID